MLRFVATLFLATLAIANAVTFGECSCKFKDGHVKKFQVYDCKIAKLPNATLSAYKNRV